MAKKLYDLCEEELAVLQEIKAGNDEIKTDVAAIRFLIRKYKFNILDPLEEKLHEQSELEEVLKQMRITLNIAERNTEVLLDALNTLLYQSKGEKMILRDEFCHPLLELSEKNIREKIAHNKQKKDFRGH